MADSNQSVEAKVANILNATRVALNVGADHGVQKGSNVTLWRTVEIIDPDTQDNLGSVRIDNLKMTVVQVDPRFSVASVRQQLPFSSQAVSAILGSSKKIRTPGQKSSDDTVVVAVGDEATVYIETPTEL